MSTLKVNKIRDTAGSADSITLDPNGGAVIAGVTTVSTVKVGSGVTITSDGDIFHTGVCTATSFVGDAASLTSIPAANIVGVCTSGLTKTGGFGKFLQVVQDTSHTRLDTTSTTYVASSHSITITPTAATSDFWINAHISASPDNHDANAVYNVHDSALGSSYNTTGQHCFTNPSNSSSGTNEGYMSNAWSNGADGDADNFRNNQSAVGGMYSPASNSASARTFTVIMKCHQSSHTMKINGVQQEHGHSISPSSYIEVFEIANGIYT